MKHIKKLSLLLAFVFMFTAIGTIAPMKKANAGLFDWFEDSSPTVKIEMRYTYVGGRTVPEFRITNQGDGWIYLENLKLRYYYDQPVDAPSANFHFDDANISTWGIYLLTPGLFNMFGVRSNPMKAVGPNADGYVDITFNASFFTQLGGLFTTWKLLPQESMTVRLDKNVGNILSKDYSYYNSSTFTVATRVPAYYKGTKIWGTEPSTSSIKVQAYNTSSDDTKNYSSGNKTYTHFKIINNGTEDIALKDVKVRYYFDSKGVDPKTFTWDKNWQNYEPSKYNVLEWPNTYFNSWTFNFWMDVTYKAFTTYPYTAQKKITGKFYKFETPVVKADAFIELGFDSTCTDYLKAGSDIEIRTLIGNVTGSEEKDYSYETGGYADRLETPAYLNGKKVWGIEPLAEPSAPILKADDRAVNISCENIPSYNVGTMISRTANIYEDFTYLTTLSGSSFKDEDVKNGTEYSYKSRYTARATEVNNTSNVVIIEGLDSKYSSAKPMAPVPAMYEPIVGDKSVTLKWSKVPGASKYYIKKGTISKSYSYPLIEVAGEDSVTYTDTNVENNKRYFYVVCSYKDAMSENSREVSAMPTSLPIPQAPTLGDLKLTTKGEVELTWSTVEGVSKYIIKRGTSSGVYDKTFDNIGSSLTSFIDSESKVDGETYYYVIYSYKGTMSNPSNERSIKIEITPKNLVLDSYKNNIITLKWDDVQGASGYKIYEKIDNGSYQELNKADITRGFEYLKKDPDELDITKAQFIVLNDGKQYSYVVKAIVNGIDSSDSNEVTTALKIEMYSLDEKGIADTIKTKYKVTNTSTDPIDVSKLKLKYFYTKDMEAYTPNASRDQLITINNIWIDNTKLATTIENQKEVEVIDGRGNDIHHNITIEDKNEYDICEIVFNQVGNVQTFIPAGKAMEFEVNIARAPYIKWGYYYQLNDYSFDAQGGTYKTWNRVLASYDGKDVWGTEPKDEIFSNDKIQILQHKVISLDSNKYAVGDVIPVSLRFKATENIPNNSVMINLSGIVEGTNIELKSDKNHKTSVSAEFTDIPSENGINLNFSKGLSKGEEVEIQYYIQITKKQGVALGSGDYKSYKLTAQFVDSTNQNIHEKKPVLNNSLDHKRDKLFDAVFEVVQSKNMQ